MPVISGGCMERAAVDELDQLSEQYDAWVDQTPRVDPFCSTTDWIIPAKRSFYPDADEFVLIGRTVIAPWMRIQTPLGRTMVPIEASWGLASALATPSPREAALEIAEWCHAYARSWDSLWLSGLTRGDALFTALVHAFHRDHRLGVGTATRRAVASLDGGYDGWLSRRSRKFRKRLRAAERKAHGVDFVDIDQPADLPSLYARILEIETRCWKARDGSGIDQGPMRTFYGQMLPRLAKRGALRCTVARYGGHDIGYIFGGLRNGTYRGLQISFDAEFAHLAPGNLLQHHTIRRLAEEGVREYDLGTEMAYKSAWAERADETVALAIR